MDDEYYDITSNLDARAILRYLNDQGIQNISGEMLKHFITDLKKLIKHDLEQKRQNKENEYVPGPERLHSATTFSSRSRSKVGGSQIMKCSCVNTCRPERVLHERNTRSAPNLASRPNDNKPLRRACSCIRVERTESAVPSKSTGSSANLIKVPIPPKKKKCDPVALYHYYTTLWTKYKSNVPGENNWSELRWTMRQKMAGSLQTDKKASNMQCTNQQRKVGTQKEKK